MKQGFKSMFQLRVYFNFGFSSNIGNFRTSGGSFQGLSQGRRESLHGPGNRSSWPPEIAARSQKPRASSYIFIYSASFTQSVPEKISDLKLAGIKYRYNDEFNLWNNKTNWK